MERKWKERTRKEEEMKAWAAEGQLRGAREITKGVRENKICTRSLVPRRSLLPRCPREVWESAGERTPSQYWQNTPDFSAILPLVTFYEFLQLHFRKNCSPIVWMCRLKCLQTAVSSNFVAYYFSG